MGPAPTARRCARRSTRVAFSGWRAAPPAPCPGRRAGRTADSTATACPEQGRRPTPSVRVRTHAVRVAGALQVQERARAVGGLDRDHGQLAVALHGPDLTGFRHEVPQHRREPLTAAAEPIPISSSPSSWVIEASGSSSAIGPTISALTISRLAWISAPSSTRRLMSSKKSAHWSWASSRESSPSILPGSTCGSPLVCLRW